MELQRIGVKQLRPNLTKTLERVCEGNDVIVTHHGHDVAVIISYKRHREAVAALEFIAVSAGRVPDEVAL